MAIVFKKNYSASTAYSIDNIVRYTDGKTYISLANSNTGHTPGASGSESYWKELAGVKYNSDTGIDVDYETTDTQVVVTMTSGSNTATISFDLADIKEY